MSGGLEHTESRYQSAYERDDKCQTKHSHVCSHEQDITCVKHKEKELDNLKSKGIII